MIPGEVDLSDWRIAIIEASKMGGTCLNRGCIPSKILVYTAEVADAIAHASRYNITASTQQVDWPGITTRLWDRIDPIHQSGIEYRRRNGIDVFQDYARFIAPKTIQVGEHILTADRFVISAGARVTIPQLDGLESVPYETSDTVMRLSEIPKHLIVLGGGFIATELGHVFAALGAKVTIVGRRELLLPAEDHDIATAFTNAANEWADLLVGNEPQRVWATESGIAVEVPTANGTTVIEGDKLLVTIGRRPNSDVLNVEAAGVKVDAKGYIRVDATYATDAAGIWAFGDIVGYHQLKHTANIEAKIVAHNLRPNGAPLRTRDLRPAPHAVFSTPQVAAIGLAEAQAVEQGIDYVMTTRYYRDAAYGWALEDTTSFVKLLADPAARTLIGAHIIGPQASNLLQLLVQGMHLGATIDDLATGQIFIHPALSEVVEQALLDLIEAVDARR